MAPPVSHDHRTGDVDATAADSIDAIASAGKGMTIHRKANDASGTRRGKPKRAKGAEVDPAAPEAAEQDAAAAGAQVEGAEAEGAEVEGEDGASGPAQQQAGGRPRAGGDAAAEGNAAAEGAEAIAGEGAAPRADAAASAGEVAAVTATAAAAASAGPATGDAGLVQRKATSEDSLEGAHAAAAVQHASSQSAGAPLDAGVRDKMEGGFGQSFGDVRIHTDGAAASAAQDLNARAFTTGSDVFFDKGQYEPGSAGGQHLLAHELAHVAQGAGGAAAKGNDGGVTVSDASDAAELQADAAADTVMAGGVVSGLSSGAATVHRDALGDLDTTSRGDWAGDVSTAEALRRAGALPEADKRRLATEATFHPMITRLAGAFNAAQMMQFFAAVPFFELRWKVYWLIISGAIDELDMNQWRRVIGIASVADMDALRNYQTGYRAFIANGPDDLVPPWDRLEGLKAGWWTGTADKVRFAVNSLSAAQRETVRGDNAMLRAILNASGTATEKFRTVTYVNLPLKWAVFWLDDAAAIASLTPVQWSQMLAEAPKAEFDELVGWAEMWTLTQAHCPAPVLQVVRQNTNDPNAVTSQLQDPVSLGLLISGLGAAGVLALATQPGTDVAVNYGHIKTNNKVTDILNGLERGMRQGERTSANLKTWFDAGTGETVVATLELMTSVRFGMTAGGVGTASVASGAHDAGAIQPWTAEALRAAWQIMERLPPGMVESNPAFLHLLRDQTTNGGAYAGRDTNASWDNSLEIGLLPGTTATAPGSTMSSKAIYGAAMPQFSQTLRHEIGHAVDNQLGVMASIQSEEWAGAWVSHGSATAWVDAMIAAGGGLMSHGYPATDVGDYRAAMIQAATSNTLFLTELNAIRAAKVPALPAVAAAPTTGPVAVLNNLNTWDYNQSFWNANNWVPQGGRDFVHGYRSNNHWWSFSHNKQATQKATNYQFRAPKEWFADAYAVYYAEQETAATPATGGLLRTADPAAADFIANQIDRGYSPNAMTGGAAARPAPGTPGSPGHP